jgi:DNA-binding response OmpR family regulator
MKKILAISNDEELLNLLNNKLTGIGFAMETMVSGDDMLNDIKNKYPDVLVVDFILGDANAAAICHQVTSAPELHQVAVIILSDMPGIDQLAAKLGSFAVIKKPMSTPALVENILAALVEQRSA